MFQVSQWLLFKTFKGFVLAKTQFPEDTKIQYENENTIFCSLQLRFLEKQTHHLDQLEKMKGLDGFKSA